jgi:hypothetical protein
MKVAFDLALEAKITIRTVYFMTNDFSIFFSYFLILKKLINKKYFLLKKNGLIFRKCFSLISGRIHFLKVIKKFKNIMIFIDYIKFDH